MRNWTIKIRFVFQKGLARLIFTTYKNLEQYLGAIQSDGRSPVQYADEYAELSGREGETKHANDYNSARENEVNKGHMDQKGMNPTKWYFYHLPGTASFENLWNYYPSKTWTTPEINFWFSLWIVVY